jgi:hypothetical protein
MNEVMIRLQDDGQGAQRRFAVPQDGRPAA